MGGMHGFGPVRPTEEDYKFSADWERRVFGLTQALAGITPFNVDEFRRQIERMPPAEYLNTHYFEKWLIALEWFLQDRGLVSADELAAGAKLFDADMAGRQSLDGAALLAILFEGVELQYPHNTAVPAFAVGTAVRVKPRHDAGHNRSPRYLRGRTGTIVADIGVFQFPDSVAENLGIKPQHLYSVSFPAADLWGADAESTVDEVMADLMESYLEVV